MTGETLNMAVARLLADQKPMEHDTYAAEWHLPRVLESGAVVWEFVYEFSDDESAGEVLRSRHYVTVSRERPEGFESGGRFDWRGGEES